MTFAVLLAVGVSVAAIVSPFFTGSGDAAPARGTGNVGTYVPDRPVNQDPQTPVAVDPRTALPTVDPQVAADDQAQHVAALFSDMHASRSSLAEALGNVDSCTNLGNAAATLHQMVDARARQLTQANSLAVDQLRGGIDLKGALVAALTASQQADAAYARWADTVAAQGCHGHPPTTADKTEGDSDSQTATQTKATAMQYWNDVAGDYGQQSVQADSI
jgi:hypothetical protein